MLGDIALGSPYGVDDFLHAGFLVAEDAENLEPQRMGNGLERPRRGFNVLLLVDQIDGGFFHGKPLWDWVDDYKIVKSFAQTFRHGAPFGAHQRHRPLRYAVLTLAAALVLGGPVGAAERKVAKRHPSAARSESPSPTAPEIADRQADLQELRGRIESLRKDLASSEENKADAADRLRESEREISTLQRNLHRLESQQGELQTRLKDLGRQSQELGTTLNQQQIRLEKLLYHQYLRGTPDSVQIALNGDDPNQVARDLHYLTAIARSRADLLGEINATLERKKALSAATREQSDALAAVEAEQKEQHGELQRQREERKAVLADVADRVKRQRQEIGNLERNEKRLSELIDRLSRLLAAQAAKAAREAKAAQEARAAQTAKPDRSRTPRGDNEPARTEAPPSRAGEVENRLEPVANSGAFARLRGNLRLPVRGTLAGRFGAPREGGGSWKGLFIRSGSGTEVKAVAGGRVVFSEWMRGFGNLLIIDHGDAYLTIYGNNDSLLKQVGEAVRGGETVATVGNSGGNPESGLYFELRRQGQAIDPLKWASLR